MCFINNTMVRLFFIVLVTLIISVKGINIFNNQNDVNVPDPSSSSILEYYREFIEKQHDDEELETDRFSNLIKHHNFHLNINPISTGRPYLDLKIYQPNSQENLGIDISSFDGVPIVRDIKTTEEPPGPEDQWSVVWYIACFSGLITFFLVVSCSEWCCRKHVRVRRTAEAPVLTQMSQIPAVAVAAQEAPPPAYDLFAPPSYDSLHSKQKEKSEYDVYVVPVHAIASIGILNTEQSSDARATDDPPSYSVVNMSFVDTATSSAENS